MSHSAYPGPDLLLALITERRLSRGSVAKALGTSKTSVIFWLQRKQRPEADMREKIARWSGNRVPVEAWRDPDEVAEIASIKPLPRRPPSGSRRSVPQPAGS